MEGSCPNWPFLSLSPFFSPFSSSAGIHNQNAGIQVRGTLESAAWVEGYKIGTEIATSDAGPHHDKNKAIKKAAAAAT